MTRVDHDLQHAQTEPMGVYVHWPFCLSKCPYCDFNSHVRASIDEGAFERALLQDLDHYADLTQGRVVGSVFFGGGTPSLMPPRITAAILDRIAARWSLTSDLEVTLEANPTSVEAERFAGFRAAGVNRVSLGVQSLNDAELKFLGRGHSAAEAIKAIDLARASFTRMNFDLIYARPHHTVAAWVQELQQAIALAADHLSLYQLTIEEGTAFHNIYRRGGFTLPDDETSAALYEVTQDICAAAGLPAYEISNHAKPGAECRHNLVYWRYGDYVGVGAGAHGRLSLGDGRAIATVQAKKPEDWLKAVESAGHGTVSRDDLSADDRAAEMIMMGLRTREGLSRARFQQRIGKPLDQVIAMDRVDTLITDGYLRTTSDGIAVTAHGAAVLNRLLADILI